MNTYVMSDIHGCYDLLQQMLEKIEFSEEDQLIIAGDYIDRGPQSYEMLKWIENCPDNVLLLCGNHDKEFAANVELMRRVMEANGVQIDISISGHARLLYELTAGMMDGLSFFDHYGTVLKLITENGASFKDLCRWAELLGGLPYLYRMKATDRRCIVVHAGYIDKLDDDLTAKGFPVLEDFFLYARDEAYMYGGIPHGMIIAGHTPTIAEGVMPFNNGRVYRFYDETQDCIFYDIDCGCAYSKVRDNARLACIRLEDEKIFYVK